MCFNDVFIFIIIITHVLDIIMLSLITYRFLCKHLPEMEIQG